MPSMSLWPPCPATTRALRSCELVARRPAAPRPARLLTSVLAATLVLRLLVIAHLHTPRAPEAWEYGLLADSVLAGNGYVMEAPSGGLHRSYMPPAYPLLLAGLGWLFGPGRYLALQLLQAVLSTGTAGLLWLLGRRLLGGPAAWAALVLAAVYPPLAVKVAFVDPVTLETFLLVLGVFLVVRLLDTRVSTGAGAAAGVALGLAVLTRPVFLACALALGAAGIVLGPARRRAVVLMLACLLLTLLPWTLRNWVVLGEPVLVSTNGGANFWIGNNTLATGDAYGTDGQPLWLRMPEPLRQRLAVATEVEQERFLYAEGLAFARSHPGRFLHLTVRRLGWFWWFRPGAGEGQQPMPLLWIWGYRLAYGAVLALATLGAWLARGRWRRLLPVYLVLASLTAVYSVFFVHTRYRMVLEPFLLLLAGQALARVWQRLSDRLRRGRPQHRGGTGE